MNVKFTSVGFCCQALAELREQTAELERLRGVWEERGLPGASRDWNAPTRAAEAQAPLALPEYKAFKEYEARQRAVIMGAHASGGKEQPLALEWAAGAAHGGTPAAATWPLSSSARKKAGGGKGTVWKAGTRRREVLAVLDAIVT